MRLVEQDPCFVSAMPDEPAFILLARDESAPKLVRQWAAIRQSLISAGLKPASDQRQIDEAYALADRMEAWRCNADEAWRKQAAFEFAAGTHDAFHDAVVHGTGVSEVRYDDFGERMIDRSIPIGTVFPPVDIYSNFAERLTDSRGETVSRKTAKSEALGAGYKRDDLMHEHGNVERIGAHLLDRQGDEFFCPRCAKRWGTDEPAPACK